MLGRTGTMLRSGKHIVEEDIPQMRLESGNSIRLKPPGKPSAREWALVVDSIACRDVRTNEREYDECTSQTSSAVNASASNSQ